MKPIRPMLLRRIADPYFANVVLLTALSYQVSSAFVDQSSYARALTSVGNVALDTSQYPYPPASAVYDGTGDTITTPITSALQPGSSDFTLECYVRVSSLPSALRFMFSTRSTTGNDAGVYLFINSSNKVEFRVPPGNGGANLVSLLSTPSLTAAAWVHVCIIRIANDFYMYFDGVNVAHQLVAGGLISVASTNGSLWIGGSSNEAGGREWLGNIGPVRWTIGGAAQRYNQTAFTPDPLPWAIR